MKKIVLSAIALIVTGTLISFKLPTTKTSEVVAFQDGNKGKAIYNKTCVACHQANGQGIPNAFPPLAKSDYLNKDVNRAIRPSEKNRYAVRCAYKILNKKGRSMSGLFINAIRT